VDFTGVEAITHARLDEVLYYRPKLAFFSFQLLIKLNIYFFPLLIFSRYDKHAYRVRVGALLNFHDDQSS
jgi:hypothetical protein